MAEAEDTRKGIEKAVAAAGNQSKLSELLGVSRQAVAKWVEQGFAPLERVVEIEAQTGIDRQELVDPAVLEKVGLDNAFGE